MDYILVVHVTIRRCAESIETIPARPLFETAQQVHHMFMKQQQPLESSLMSCRALMTGHLALYEDLIDRLKSASTGSGAPAVGERFHDFVLPDLHGQFRRLSDLLASGPAVVSFNRGSWCPFCKEEVTAWADSRDALADVGGRLIIVTPEVGGRAQALATLAGPDAVVLCDVDLGVALRSGLAFPIGGKLQQVYDAAELDLGAIYGKVAGFLPTPATYLLAADRTVRFAFADPDFRCRADPAEVMAALI